MLHTLRNIKRLWYEDYHTYRGTHYKNNFTVRLSRWEQYADGLNIVTYDLVKGSYHAWKLYLCEYFFGGVCCSLIHANNPLNL